MEITNVVSHSLNQVSQCTGFAYLQGHHETQTNTLSRAQRHVCTFTLICSCTCKHHECTLWFGSYDTPLSHQLLCCMFDAAVRPLWFSASDLTTGRANEVHSNLLYWFLSVWRTRNFFFNFFIFRDPRANSGTLLIVCTTVVVQHVLNVWCVIQYMFVCLHAWSQCYEYSLCVWGAHKPAFLKVWGAETWQVGPKCTRWAGYFPVAMPSFIDNNDHTLPSH